MESTEDHFSLKWSNFRSSLTEGFHDFLQEEMMVDVTLAAEGKFVQAHKLVLSVCSPYFKNLFKVNPCKHPIVILKDVGHNELSYMLEFMYKGEVGVKHEDLPSFLKLADTLKVKGLAGEKVKGEECNSPDKVEPATARVRKKKGKNFSPDYDKENTESELVSEKPKERRGLKGRKRRWSDKSESVSKVKREKCDERQLASVGDNASDDDDDNPLVKLISDKAQSGEGSKCSESQCDLKNGFGGVDDGDDDDDEEDDDAGHTDDFNISPSFFHPENTTETEQTPQDPPVLHAALRISPVWNYYVKVQNNIAVCKICGKILKGAQTSQAEYHLRAKHPEEASAFRREKAEWLEKKKKMNSSRLIDFIDFCIRQ